MVGVIGRTEGRYEVEETPYGRGYAWRPGCVVVECDCGERLALTRSKAACRCGADHAAVVRGGQSDRESGTRAPWLDEYWWWRKEGEDHTHPEHHYWQELSALE